MELGFLLALILFILFAIYSAFLLYAYINFNPYKTATRPYPKFSKYLSTHQDSTPDYAHKLNNITFQGNHPILVLKYSANLKSVDLYQSFLKIQYSLEKAIYTIISQDPNLVCEYNALLNTHYSKYGLSLNKKSIKSAKDIILHFLQLDPDNSYNNLIQLIENI